MKSDTPPRNSSSPVYSSSSNSWEVLGGDNKQTLLNLTPNLLIPSTPARETSEFFDNLNNLDPIKFSPPDSVQNCKQKIMTDTQSSYSTFAKLNPYHDECCTRFGDFCDAGSPKQDIIDAGRKHGHKPPGLSLSQSTDFGNAQNTGHDTMEHTKKYGHKSPSMPHSQSESNIDFRATARDDHSIRVGKKFATRADRNRSSDESTATSSSSYSRGRSLNRTPSPVKVLDDIREDRTPPPKRSRSPIKQLFGSHGWLGKSMSMKELPSEEYRKGGIKQWSGKLKQRVEHLTEDVSKFVPTNVYHHRSPSKTPSKSKFSVSLSPPMQAKLYSEMELMICATANQYLSEQHKEGRMSVESVAKVMQFWASKNRPQVIEFMFDQTTQRDLVLYNFKAFRFYGPNAENAVAMNTMMASWKTLGKEMSVRTFCTPDSVIKKQMHDTYKILEMMGAPLVTFLAFQEIQVKALQTMKDEQEKKDENKRVQFGVEKRWNPPAKTPEELRELENPFA